MHNQHQQALKKKHQNEHTLSSVVSEESHVDKDETSVMVSDNMDADNVSLTDSVHLKIRNRKAGPDKPEMVLEYQIESKEQKEVKAAAEKKAKYESWKRMLLLIIAITVHNIPGMYLFQ